MTDLDAQIARIEGWDVTKYGGLEPDISIPPPYSTDWAIGGPLIEKYKIDVYWWGRKNQEWEAVISSAAKNTSGPTPLIAVCRAIVEAHGGEG